MDQKEQRQGPLSSQELESDAGEGGTFLDEDAAPGHTLPESERDRSMGGNREGQERAVTGTMLPPD
jgi:hypothetical protein